MNSAARDQLDLESRRALLRELTSSKCRCGSDKKHGRPFCRECYWSLAPETRAALYQKIGEGYEEAFQRACRFLDPKLKTKAASR